MDNNSMWENNSYDTPVLESKPILVMGILSCALCWLGIGVIFAAIGLSKAKAYAAVSRFDGKARAGKITSIIGLASSIFFIVYWIIIIAVIGSTIALTTR